MRAKLILTILLATLCALSASAQPQPIPAPDHHAATGLTLPPLLGQAAKRSSTDYAKTINRPDLGYSWNYGVQDVMSGTVFIYQLGATSIPSGTTSPTMTAQFEQAYGDIRTAASQRAEELTVKKSPADCPVAQVIFRCMTLYAQGSGRPRLERTLMLTSYRNHFVKVRIDSAPGPQTDAVVSSFVAALAALLH